MKQRMPAAPVPPKLDELGERAFSFYPPILNIEHNEWVLRRGTWSEILVFNPKMEIEVWIPRSFLGEISRVDHPVMIVGLRKELEFKGGTVWPHERRVLEMRRSGPQVLPQDQPGAPSAPPKFGLRLESGEWRIGRLIAGVLVAGIAACFLVVSYFRGGVTGERVQFSPLVQVDLGLTAADGFPDVVRKLGAPDADRWLSDAGERQYRALSYPKRNVIVVLMGADRDKALYIGSKDSQWKNVHAVTLPGGRNTDSILRSLKKF